jgi:aspartyl-tRNA(Asn)/glutamyl-tRNA(Gln) amidotransferase subunit A
MGNHLKEAELLQAAQAFQQATDWHTRSPEGF